MLSAGGCIVVFSLFICYSNFMQLQPITKQQYKVLFNQQSLVLKKLEEINERLNQLEAEDHGPYKISFVRKIHRRIQEPAPYLIGSVIFRFKLIKPLVDFLEFF